MPAKFKSALAIAAGTNRHAIASAGTYTYLRQVKKHPVLAFVQADIPVEKPMLKAYAGFDGVVFLTPARYKKLNAAWSGRGYRVDSNGKLVECQPDTITTNRYYFK